MEKRYIRNIATLTEEENNELKNFKVCVLGCGGLGGYIIEMLARLGIGHLKVIDMDVFDESNLNRQILSNENNIGLSKSEEARRRIKEVNSNVKVEVINQKFSLNNGKEILNGYDVVVDALDSIESRFYMQDICNRLNIPMIHGAIGGWYGQVCTILPGDNTLNKIYKTKEKGIEKDLGNPSFTPANIASIQVSEVIKVLFNKGEIIRNKLLVIDLLYNDYDFICL